MNIKEKFFQALKKEKGQFDEIELGESINLDKETTMKIISQLLSEHKIEYELNGACNYAIKKQSRLKTKKSN
jgi:hypothetical protein